MYLIEYKDEFGRKRAMNCTPEEIFELYKNETELVEKITEIWKLSNGYMGRASVEKRKNGVVLIRDHYGDLIEAR